MRWFSALLLSFAALAAAPVHAREVVVYEVVEKWTGDAGAERFVSGVEETVEGEAYGPFRVLGDDRAALVGITDERSPAQFRALLAAHPGIATLELVDCPGTFDDRANLQLGRMIRAAGIATHVPDGGSVRSGAVELFLAGAERRIDDGAEFAVHAWEDEDGREATDFALTAPENRKYLSYYEEMGFDAAQAAAFYAMTNSVPFERALWLDAAEMRRWLPETPRPATPLTAPEAEAEAAFEPQLAYLDLGLSLY